MNLNSLKFACSQLISFDKNRLRVIMRFVKQLLHKFGFDVFFVVKDCI
jgi:hypothetical protein